MHGEAVQKCGSRGWSHTSSSGTGGQEVRSSPTQCSIDEIEHVREQRREESRQSRLARIDDRAEIRLP